MSLERAREYLIERGYGDRLIIPEETSATVEDAARALHCEPDMIAKTLSFLTEEGPVLILAEGTARIDNRKFKDALHCKAKMIPPDRLEELVGHAAGGVCPFGIREGVRVFLDESLRKHDTVYPAAGDARSAVRLSVGELEACIGACAWIDVCRETR